MNRLDYHRERKKVTKHHFIRGTKQGAEGKNEVKIENSAGVPFRKIEIKGNTVVEIKNQALEYSSYLSAIESYTTGGVSGTYAIKLPDGWQGKELTYKLEEKTPLSGVDLYLASGSAFLFSDTLPLIENGIVSEQKAKNYTHLIFKGIFDEEIENENGDILSVPTDITRFWQGHSLIVTSAVCPEFPAIIKSAGNKEGAIFVQSHNLIELKDGSFSETDSDGNVLSWEIKDGIVTVNGKWNKFRVLNLDYKNYNQAYYEAGEYTYTTAYYQGEGFAAGGLSCDWKFNCFDEAGTQTNTTGWTNTKTRTVETQTFAHRFRIQHIQVYINGNTEYTNLRYAPALFKGKVEAANMPQFEPYFNKKIPIPIEVEAEGKKAPLPLTIYDRLIVDGAGKRVIYEKRSGVWEFKGTEAFSVGTFNNDLFAYKIELSRLGFKESTGDGYSTHFIPKPRTEIANRGDACFDYSSFGEKNVCFLYDTLGYSYTDMLLAKNDFKAWLTAQYEAGTPVTIVVEYKEPEMIDITNTDFGKALLSLSLEQGKNGYLCLKSEPSITSLACEYYSCQDQSKVTLLVSYKDKNGTRLIEDKSYLVRKGAYYQISVPHIDGYTREMQEVFGKADTDTTIDLIYTEE